MRKSIELQNKLGEISADYRRVLDAADSYTDGRMKADVKERLDKMDVDMDDLQASIQRHQAQEEREASNGSRQNRTGDPKNENRESDSIRASKEYGEAFTAALASGRISAKVSHEIRAALQADLDDQGGVLVASEQFANRFIQAVDNEVFIRQLATKSTVTTAAGLGIPTLASDIDDADWTAEIATGSEDTGTKFGKRELKPHPLAKRIKLSKKLLRLMPMVEGKVMERLAYKFAVAMEKGYLTGNGVNQPLGVFTASTNGISTARDFATGNTSTAITADGLIEALYGLKGQYQRTATWIFHRDALKMIRKLKDTTGQYLWQPSIAGGQPATIMDRPFKMSEFAPNTFTTGQYVGIVGDFSRYEIVDALDMTVQVLTELYAETNQNGYIGRLETDGMPVLEEAFSRVTLA